MDIKYYKAFDLEGKYIGATSTSYFVRFQKKHGIMLFSDADNAQYILIDGVPYHTDWLKKEPEDKEGQYGYCQLYEISENEYDVLSGIIDYEPLPPEEEQAQDVTEDEINAIDAATFDYVKEQKMNAMKAACTRKILDGVDVNDKHYTMSTTDQINIMTMYNAALSDIANHIETYYPYHADGELCRYYSAQEIIEIAKKAQELITVQTTYMNSLKAYIDSLTTMEDIAKVTYGMEIPEEFQSQVYKDIIVQNDDEIEE